MTSPDPDPTGRLEQALDLAFRFLGRRERTVLELRRHLEGRRIEPPVIEQAVVTLTEQRYLDDAGFARRLVEDKRALEQWGTERIERRLRTRGVPPELIEAALGVPDPEAELAAARSLLARRFSGLPDDPRERRRALGVLVRRGYDLELAGDAVRAHVRGD